MCKVLIGQSSGWLEQLVLRVIKLSMEPDKPAKQREKTTSARFKSTSRISDQTQATSFNCSVFNNTIGSEKKMKTEETGRPTYQSYSSIPIEQESGPRAAQRPRGGKRSTQARRKKKREYSTQVTSLSEQTSKKNHARGTNRYYTLPTKACRRKKASGEISPHVELETLLTGCITLGFGQAAALADAVG